MPEDVLDAREKRYSAAEHEEDLHVLEAASQIRYA